jgi:bis(5'-nucleosyl)-tetraphosphatase (symmetrical)
VLRMLHDWGDAAVCLLGNHDLHLLAVAKGYGRLKKRDTLDTLLSAPDAPELLRWLQQRPLAVHAHGWLMVHAGVFPSWDTDQTMSLAGEVEAMMRSPESERFFANMYGNEPDHWRDDWQDLARWRCVVNALTRMRLIDAAGHMDFAIKDNAANAPAQWMPWFEHPARQTQGQAMAFGHWSTLRAPSQDHVLPLDTGCVWGGSLSAARILDEPGQVEVIRQPCPMAQAPG